MTGSQPPPSANQADGSGGGEATADLPEGVLTALSKVRVAKRRTITYTAPTQYMRGLRSNLLMFLFLAIFLSSLLFLWKQKVQVEITIPALQVPLWLVHRILLASWCLRT